MGLINLGWGQYSKLCRSILHFAHGVIKEEVQKVLLEQIWRQARNRFVDEEVAKNRLVELGFSNDLIESYAREIASAVTQKLAEHIPDA